MKKLAVMLCFWIGLTGLAHAGAKYLKVESTCGSSEITQEWLEEQQELPFAGGPGAIRLPDDLIATGDWKIYVNPNSKSFSIMMFFPEDDMVCLIGAGQLFTPLKQTQGDNT